MKKTVLTIFIALMAIGAQAQAIGFCAGADEIYPAQTRCSIRNVHRKMRKLMKRGGFNVDDPFPVIKAPFGLVLADGHHHVLAGMGLGIPIVPVVIVDDLSHLTEEQFWEEAADRGWAYLYDCDGNKVSRPPAFSQLRDDPNRYFATLTVWECAEGEEVAATDDDFLWIKVGHGVPFIEFIIADALYAEGVVYSYDMGDTPSREFIEKARQVLQKANISGLQLISASYTHSGA